MDYQLSLVVLAVMSVFSTVQGMSRAIPDMVYTAKVCEGTELVMDCPRGYIIELNGGSFGRTDETTCVPNGETIENPEEIPCTGVDLEDIPEIVACAGRRECIVDVSATAFGVNPCPSSTFSKYLNMSFNCIKTRLKSFVCEGNTFSMNCPNNDVIQVTDVLYGRNDASRCSRNTQIQTTNCSAADAYEKVSNLCKHRTSCDIPATEDMFGEPCQGTSKLLEIEIQCASCVNEYGSDSSCDRWADNGECESNPAWMMAWCRKSCWKCDRTDSCSDVSSTSRCIGWALEGECHKNKDWMAENCQHTCNLCHETFIDDDNLFDEEWIAPDPEKAPTGTLSNKACEGDSVVLGCPLGKYIQVYDTFYGRLSLDVCPVDEDDVDEPQSDKCTSTASPYHKISKTCDGRRDCILTAFSNVFGEPCEGTVKYLKVNHSCQSCVDSKSDSFCTQQKEEGKCESERWQTHMDCFRTCSGCDYAENCQNKWLDDEDCDFWASGLECETNKNWMAEYCPKSCRLCNANNPGAGSPGGLPPEELPDPTTTKEPKSTTKGFQVIQEDCNDLLGTELCEEEKDKDSCSISASNMLKMCRKTCGFCTVVTLPPLEENCRNILEDEYCERIADKNGDNECQNEPEFMAINCRLACSLCRPISSTSTSTSTSSSTSQTTTTLSTTAATSTSTEKITTLQGNCDDELCLEWVAGNQCKLNPTLMATYCTPTCCSEAPTSTSSSTTTTTRQTTSQSTTTKNTTPTPRSTKSESTSTATTSSIPPSSSTSSSTATSTEQGECDVLCTSWVLDEQCERNPSLMATFCPAICCSATYISTSTTTSTSIYTTTTPKPGTCTKKNERSEALCTDWVESGYCVTSPTLMMDYCTPDCCVQSSTESTTPVLTKPTTTQSSVVVSSTMSDKAFSCERPCVNGECIAPNTCRCSDGYRGVTCEQVVCPGETSCHGHGECVAPNVCLCYSGYTGAACDLLTCPGEEGLCSGNGDCIGPYECQCYKGWMGEACDQPLCEDVNNCGENGVCVGANTCWCYPHYSGKQCDECKLDQTTSQSCISCPPCSHGTCQMQDETENEISYLGCFKDDILRRDLNISAWKSFEDTTVLSCIMRCYDYGYKYAGLQNGKECYCGTSYGSHGKSDSCNTQCAGGVRGEICGGSYANSIYLVYQGRCTCDGPEWTGSLCDKCSPGYSGEFCNIKIATTPILVATTPPLPPVSTRIISRQETVTPPDDQLDTLPLEMHLQHYWSEDYYDMNSIRTKLLAEKIQYGLFTLYKPIFPALEDVEILSFRPGSVLVQYNLIFEEPIRDYNQKLKLHCKGELGYGETPAEGWEGSIALPDDLGYMDYYILPLTRDRCNRGKPEDPVSSADGTEPDFYCYNNGSVVTDSSGIKYCRCEGDFYGTHCEYYKDEFHKWFTLAIVILAVILPLLVLIIICYHVRTTQEKQDTHKKSNNTQPGANGTASRTFQFYKMGKDSGATKTIKRQHSKRNGPPVHSDSSMGYDDTLEENTIHGRI